MCWYQMQQYKKAIADSDKIEKMHMGWYIHRYMYKQWQVSKHMHRGEETYGSKPVDWEHMYAWIEMQ